MSWPEKDVIVAFAIGDASTVRGSCLEKTGELKKRARRRTQPSSSTEEITAVPMMTRPGAVPVSSPCPTRCLIRAAEGDAVVDPV
jgi:hypothetical protein